MVASPRETDFLRMEAAEMDARSCVVCQLHVENEDENALHFLRSEPALVVQTRLTPSQNDQKIILRNVTTERTCGHIVHRECWRPSRVSLSIACLHCCSSLWLLLLQEAFESRTNQAMCPFCRQFAHEVVAVKATSRMR
jgi:hypothetical protein